MCVTFLLSSVVTGTRRYFKGNKVFLNADFSLYQKRNQNYTRFLKISKDPISKGYGDCVV